MAFRHCRLHLISLHGFPTEFFLRFQKNLSSFVHFLIAVIRLQAMSLHGICQLQIQNMSRFFLQLLILNREHNLHTAVQISRHPVRASHIKLFMPVIIERKDSGMLQEASYNRADADILTDTRNSHNKTADTAHDKIDLHACRRCFIQSKDDLLVTEGITFCDNVRFFSCFGILGLSLDQLKETFFHPDRSHQQTVRRRRPGR